MTYERTSEAQRHKNDAMAAVVLNLRLAREAMELVQDWEHSWPNGITNFAEDIESVVNRIRVFQRKVQPPTVENDAGGGQVREDTDYHKVFDDGTEVIKIQDENL